MNRPSPVFLATLALLLAGCDQLGNPPQYATPPTPWKDELGHLVTTTRSFKDEKTIRRLVSEGLDDLDYTDRSIGPDEALTIVVVVPHRLAPQRRKRVGLATIFKLKDGPAIVRKWRADPRSRKWTAAFALPEPPLGAVTSVAP